MCFYLEPDPYVCLPNDFELIISLTRLFLTGYDLPKSYEFIRSKGGYFLPSPTLKSVGLVASWLEIHVLFCLIFFNDFDLAKLLVEFKLGIDYIRDIEVNVPTEPEVTNFGIFITCVELFKPSLDLLLI